MHHFNTVSLCLKKCMWKGYKFARIERISFEKLLIFNQWSLFRGLEDLLYSLKMCTSLSWTKTLTYTDSGGEAESLLSPLSKMGRKLKQGKNQNLWRWILALTTARPVSSQRGQVRANISIRMEMVGQLRGIASAPHWIS